MADHSKIEWTDATWNPITGCSLMSEGCRFCYAAELAATRLKNHPSRVGLTKKSAAGVVQFNGKVRFNDDWLDQPLRWRKPRMIFVCAHADLFHENVPDDWIDKIFAVMALCPQHTFQVLTKRPERMKKYVSAFTDEALQWERLGDAGGWLVGNRAYEDAGAAQWPLPNVWFGVSVEDQVTADTRIPYLLDTPAAVRFLSAEPLLGPVNLHEFLLGYRAGHPAKCVCGHPHGFTRCPNYGRVSKQASWPGGACKQFRKAPFADGLHWVIAGGESGRKARPMHPQWVRDLRDKCAAAEVPFLFKQWGSYLPWEPAHGPCWRAQNGQCEDHHILFPSDWDTDPTWDDGLGFVAEGLEHFAFQKVGKGAAGRTLDGVTHDGFPEVRS
ncbi:Phage protein Gp37/Gp68 [Labrenzia sp. THAF82]|uniref:DUF5131 family protein n=1 Tax=Labrenzia sp. THAF82 TaxID=2587861 RepID=UPI001269036B|nr:phage Gp37/Gp68 family protein [Labrenzia sp. THAF82]QFT31795.1 Phage protein Gp37/Gp68 [Labrenzia sp. THAF82]